MCGLQKRGEDRSLRSRAEREEGQDGLLQGVGGWKPNQPDVPSNSRKKMAIV